MPGQEPMLTGHACHHREAGYPSALPGAVGKMV